MNKLIDCYHPNSWQWVAAMVAPIMLGGAQWAKRGVFFDFDSTMMLEVSWGNMAMSGLDLLKQCIDCDLDQTLSTWPDLQGAEIESTEEHGLVSCAESMTLRSTYFVPPLIAETQTFD